MNLYLLGQKYGAIWTTIKSTLIWKINRTKSCLGTQKGDFFLRYINVRKSIGSRPISCFMSDWPQKKCKGAGNLRLYFIIAVRTADRCLVQCCLCSMNNSKTMYRVPCWPDCRFCSQFCISVAQNRRQSGKIEG